MGSVRKEYLRTEPGFTLIELIMVIVVLGILSVHVMTRMSGNTMELRSKADQLAMDIRQTQAYSMSNTGVGDFSIQSTATDTYQIRNPVGTALSTTTLSGVTLTNFALSFDGRGQPNAGVTITLTMGTSTRTVQVVATTGLVR
ncbi:MAG: prepilin-type N-terminal cleavage/methylation domain-containing protein [Magnetococcales bacterium]|nr:prepilin-type N-terminal cleavage/methylation domain-containing protein [Magnetococcales bacterium]MBF0321519.1 prepilin-type N-terminal cleavage/methylation domain-containing protein [Magnetococcales bacterium]